MKRLLILVLFSFALRAQEVERFLLPIHLLGPTGGAFGSQWVSELRIVNTGTSEASIENYRVGECRIVCVPEPIPPGVSAPGDRVRTFIGGPIPGALLLVKPEFVDQFVFTARVRDTSRAAQGWGTWLPVVHESQARPAIHLLDVPVDAQYRQLLRVYSFALARERSVRVRVYDASREFPAALPAEPDALLAERSLPLVYESDFKPIYAQLDLAGLTGSATRVRLLVEGDFGVWAMVSVTNNVTQEVTVMLPHVVP